MSGTSFEKIHFQIPPEPMDYIDKNIVDGISTLEDVEVCLRAIRASLLYKYPSAKSDFSQKRTNCLGATNIFNSVLQGSFDTKVALVSNLPWQQPDRKIGLHTVSIVQIGEKTYLADPTPVAGYMHGQMEEVARVDGDHFVYEDKILGKTCNLQVLNHDELEAIQDCMVIRTNFPQVDEQTRDSLCDLLPRLRSVPSYFAIASVLIDKITGSHDFINRAPVEAVVASKISQITDPHHKKVLTRFQRQEDEEKQVVADRVHGRLNVETDIYRINYLYSILQSMDFRKPSIDYESFSDRPFPIKYYEKFMINNQTGRCASSLYSGDSSMREAYDGN